jgi:hypothetical protein
MPCINCGSINILCKNLCKKCYNKNYLKKYYNENKEIFKETARLWKQNNPLKSKEIQKKYRETHKDYVQIWCKKNPLKSKVIKKRYKDNHREEIQLKANIYAKKNIKKATQRRQLRYKNDINFRILTNLRIRLKQVLKKNKKQDKTIALIGCSIKNLKQYLEQRFKPNMTWENYGQKGWHIDHIIPCCKFDFSNINEQRQCFHYNNLQPLWWYENIKKRGN